jgi:hypothetical protein
MEQKIKYIKTKLTLFSLKCLISWVFKSGSMQALFHFLQPLPNFFGQVMHFCKFA